MARRRPKVKKHGKQQGTIPNIDTEAPASAVASPGGPDVSRNGAQQDKPQYQHYIPRFIIRNYALEDHLTHSRERHEIYYFSLLEKRLYIGDVDTSFGVFDMYADIKNVDKLQWVEEKLGNLEQAVSGIIIRILGLDTEVTMTFEELVLLRRFLWIMSFRYPSRRSQYTENRFCEAGKKVEEEFMHSKGRTTLDDVWLENMRGFLMETVDDALDVTFFDVVTKEKGDTNIGYLEYSDYLCHNMSTFLCIWEAEAPYEFVLTDNGFGIYESDAGRAFPSQANHYFYPISPRRILVAAKVWFKPNLDGYAVHLLEAVQKTFGLNPSKSWLANVRHVPPKPKYHNMPEGPMVGIYLLRYVTDMQWMLQVHCQGKKKHEFARQFAMLPILILSLLYKRKTSTK